MKTWITFDLIKLLQTTLTGKSPPVLNRKASVKINPLKFILLLLSYFYLYFLNLP